MNTLDLNKIKSLVSEVINEQKLHEKRRTDPTKSVSAHKTGSSGKPGKLLKTKKKKTPIKKKTVTKGVKVKAKTTVVSGISDNFLKDLTDDKLKVTKKPGIGFLITRSDQTPTVKYKYTGKTLTAKNQFTADAVRKNKTDFQEAK